jgi:hypothetical protein
MYDAEREWLRCRLCSTVRMASAKIAPAIQAGLEILKLEDRTRM